jgi:hypothetical protein
MFNSKEYNNMETKIDIAWILKDKPQGTKLYDLLRNIDVELDKVHITDVGNYIECISTNEVGSTIKFDYSKLGTEGGWLDGLQILLPSKGMRDWSVFSWKKGDVLAGAFGALCIFDKWANDDYTRFDAKFVIPKSRGTTFEVEDWHKVTNEACIRQYIRDIEEDNGGKLNLTTLEIENNQPEFKDGDIVFMKGIKSKLFANCIFILKGEYKDGDERAFYYAFYNADNKFTEAEYGNTKVHYSLRSATDSEKQQLFDALAKKGKTWDAEKKTMVDLKPKCKFKPFDKVLGRNEKDDVWEAELFSHYREESQYPFRCIGFSRKYCIPYNEETAHLLGTTDEWKGGEG